MGMSWAYLADKIMFSFSFPPVFTNGLSHVSARSPESSLVTAMSHALSATTTTTTEPKFC